jgi:hypothetical protein
MKRKFTAVALAIGVIAALTGPAVAGHLASVTSYTGCLVSKDGVIIKIKAGDAPTSPCSGGMVQVHFSGGDITSISVTGALTGGGDNGAITIGLKPEFTLPSGCVSGNIAEWSGSAWVCGVDNDTTYAEGTGLDLTGTTFSIELGYRLPSDAAAGDSVIKAADGTWDPQRYAKANQACSSGQFVEGVTSTGGLDCGAPAAASGLPHGWFVKGGTINFGGTIDVLTLDLPAGVYFLAADVEVVNRDDDTDSAVTCTLGTTTIDFSVDAGTEEETYGSITGVANHPGGPLSLRCFEHAADADIARSNLSAIQLSGLN